VEMANGSRRELSMLLAAAGGCWRLLRKRL
jgi:hypothetical protein